MQLIYCSTKLENLSSCKERIYTTKVFANHLKYDQVIEACEGSLSRLKTDYLDLYQIHWPSGSYQSEVVPIEETMNALNKLKEQGKIRAIGVSIFSRTQLEEASQYGRIDSLQPPYSLFWRQVEKDAMPYCIENNISILAYSSLAQGLLTGKFGRGHQFEQGDHRAKNKLFKGENYEPDFSREVLKSSIGGTRGTMGTQCTLAQLSLAWLIAQPQTNAIAGARNAQQASQNAKATDIKLSDEELEAIEAIARHVTDHLDNNPVMWDWDS